MGDMGSPNQPHTSAGNSQNDIFQQQSGKLEHESSGDMAAPVHGTPVVSNTITDSEVNQWFDVGLIKGNNYVVTQYIIGPETGAQVTLESQSDTTNLEKKPLLPGTVYRFRFAGVNGCGRGPWSEPVAFKTCVPGFPGAPSNIKITRVSLILCSINDVLLPCIVFLLPSTD